MRICTGNHSGANQVPFTEKEDLGMSDILLRAQVRVQTALYSLRHRQEGQGLGEYGLIIASIAILLIVAMLFLAGKIDDLFSETGTSVESPRPWHGDQPRRDRCKTRQRECAGPVTPSTGPAHAFPAQDHPFGIGREGAQCDSSSPSCLGEGAPTNDEGGDRR